MSHLFACIMAGGSGTRFWPQSRAALPKQFLSLEGSQESLLQATLRRIRKLVPIDHVFVVTSNLHAEETARQLPELPRENILGEPAGRNTAPCVGWAAVHVKALDPEGVMAVLPADPYITDEDRYLAVLERALATAAAGGLVTVGIQPTRPETGYGYIEPGARLSTHVAEVARFVEKPNLQDAQRFVAAGMFWNSGMFFFRADAILAQIDAHQRELSTFLSDCAAAIGAGTEGALVQDRYATLPNVSIDTGIMEKATPIKVVLGDFGWHDVGSWTSAWELADRDAHGNACLADALILDSRDCYVRGPKNKLIALVGLRDLVVVDTEDALLVIPRERSQEVKEVVSRLRQRTDGKYL